MLNKLQRRERLDSLNKLRFLNYYDYLNSELWKKIRKNVLKRDNHLCKFCNKKATQVHHTSYDYNTMKGDDLNHLYSCCGFCHKKGHRKKEASKPSKIRKCPRCNKQTLTYKEEQINIMGNLQQKTVCKYCRGTIRLQYKKDHDVVTAPKYKDLPNYYKWHIGKRV